MRTIIGARRSGDPPILVASSNQLASALLHWVPRREDVAEMVRATLAWHRAHPSGYADVPSGGTT